MEPPVLPRYGESALSDLLPSLGARLGLPGGEDVLGLPASDRFVLLLIDGLGLANLRAAASSAPYLTSLLTRDATRTLTSVAPTTTAAALTSIGTGLVPGQHGMAGYTFRNPFDGTLLNALFGKPGLSGLDLQPRLTAFERLTHAGRWVTTILPAPFENSGLTQAGLRGGRFVGVTDENDAGRRIEQTVDAATSAPRSLTYVYERRVDHAGHGAGWLSEEWRECLAWSDRLAAELRAALPSDVRLLITADHGMVDVPRTTRVIAEDAPGLLADVDLLAGEPRFRFAYTRRPDAVAARWRDVLGDEFWVHTRAEAFDEGWFGPVASSLADRWGDVLAASAGASAIMSRTSPNELKLIGMHGGLTAAELDVPLLVD